MKCPLCSLNAEEFFVGGITYFYCKNTENRERHFFSYDDCNEYYFENHTIITVGDNCLLHINNKNIYVGKNISFQKFRDPEFIQKIKLIL